MKITSKPDNAVKIPSVYTVVLNEREAQLLAGLIGQCESEKSAAAFNNSLIRKQLEANDVTTYEMSNLVCPLYNLLTTELLRNR